PVNLIRKALSRQVLQFQRRSGTALPRSGAREASTLTAPSRANASLASQRWFITCWQKSGRWQSRSRFFTRPRTPWRRTGTIRRRPTPVRSSTRLSQIGCHAIRTARYTLLRGTPYASLAFSLITKNLLADGSFSVTVEE